MDVSQSLLFKLLYFSEKIPLANKRAWNEVYPHIPEVYIIEEDRWELFDPQFDSMERVPVISLQGDFYERIQNFECILIHLKISHK